MAKELVWAEVMRPRVPLVYLDLFAVVYMARALRGDAGVPPGYRVLYDAARRAKRERRAMFPLGSEHIWELTKIADPRQRGLLADILEELSDFQYLLGGTSIAELELEAGIAHLMGEQTSTVRLALIRPTLGNAFGFVGGVKIVDAEGRDGSAEVRATMPDSEFDARIAKLNYEMERALLRGPSDEDMVTIRQNPQYQPERALVGQRSRVAFENETRRILDADPKWRRGRLRDLISGRELVHEWLDMLTRIRFERIRRGLPPFETHGDQLGQLLAAMPHSQVAISVKTRFHRNPNHQWTTNHISDIDAVSVAFAYCEAVFPDKEVRAALLSSKELRALKTFVPRRPAELAEWLDALPAVTAPDLMLPHPINPVAA